MRSMPIEFFPAHDHISVHAKLIQAGYSAADFPVWNPEWDKAVTKRAKLTDKCTFTRSFPCALTDGFHRLEFDHVSKVERNGRNRASSK
jgi:hypothetical protein